MYSGSMKADPAAKDFHQFNIFFIIQSGSNTNSLLNECMLNLLNDPHDFKSLHHLQCPERGVLEKLKLNEVYGSDGIPTTLLKHSPRNELCN